MRATVQRVVSSASDRAGARWWRIILVLVLAVVIGGCTAPRTVEKAASKGYAFWPALPNEPRVQFLVSYDSSADVQPLQSGFDAMLYGKQEALPIQMPYGVAMRDGKIYVCDIRTPGLTILDLRNRQGRLIAASGQGAIQKAVDVTFGSDGMMYVVDQSRGGIAVFDANDRFVRFMAPRDVKPVSAAVYGDEIFVSDFAGQNIKVLDRHTGQVRRSVGAPGDEPGQFTRPLCVRVDNDGNLIVTDVIRCRIHRLTRDGQVLATFGETGNRPGFFVRPKHLGVDKNGLLYIVDAGFSNVQVFDEENKVLDYFGTSGGHPGAMELPAGLFVNEDPADLALFSDYIHPAFQAERLIIVTNQFGRNKVSVYAQGQLRPGRTIADVTPQRAQVASGTMDASQVTQIPLQAEPGASSGTAPAEQSQVTGDPPH